MHELLSQWCVLQGDRLQEVVSQLQAAIHPVTLPSKAAPFGQQELPLRSRGSADMRTLPVIKEQASKPLLPKPKPDSSADEELRI